MTITKEQETTIEMTLMDYFLDMEDFIQGNKTLNVMNVRRPKAALIKILEADLNKMALKMEVKISPKILHKL